MYAELTRFLGGDAFDVVEAQNDVDPSAYVYISKKNATHPCIVVWQVGVVMPKQPLPYAPAGQAMHLGDGIVA